MLRSAFVLLLALPACADLKTAEPSSEESAPAAPAKPASKTSATTETAPPKTAVDDIAPASPTDAGASSTPGANAAAVPTSAAALCDAICAYRDRCETGGPPADLCAKSCRIDYTFNGPHLSSKYVAYVANECLPALSCKDYEEPCLNAWPAIETDPIDVPVVHACLVNVRKCPTQLAGNTCYRPLAYDEATRAKVAACYDEEDCNDIRPCVDRVMHRF